MFRSVAYLASGSLRKAVFGHLRTESELFSRESHNLCGVCVRDEFELRPTLPSQSQSRWLQTTCFSCKEDRKSMLSTVKAVDEGADGERSVDLDAAVRMSSGMFPDENTPNQLFDGVPFNEVPICSIKVSHNNTLMNLADYKGTPLVIRSCGMEGFKNAKKGTNIAAQATAISLSMKALALGLKNIRVRIRGLGPGRTAAIKGLQMGGMNIISISDTTPVSMTAPGPRPRKQRKL